MNDAVRQMIEPYHCENVIERKNALREVAQEIALCGLSRAGFFKQAAFYGGTALRVFHGIDRFSEDMDFSLMAPNGDFRLEDYLSVLESEFAAFGFSFRCEPHGKRAGSAIESAFLKGGTKQHLLLLYEGEAQAENMPDSELVRIKLEIDTDPAPFASFERSYRLLPIPFEVNLYDMPSLFAGKCHAVICRAWKNRVKGRDLYDFVFYCTRRTPLNVAHLWAKLRQTGTIEPDAEFGLAEAKALLCTRFDQIDFAQAKADVAPFLKDTRSLDVWSADFFKFLVQGLEGQ